MIVPAGLFGSDAPLTCMLTILCAEQGVVGLSKSQVAVARSLHRRAPADAGCKVRVLEGHLELFPPALGLALRLHHAKEIPEPDEKARLHAHRVNCSVISMFGALPSSSLADRC